MKPYLFSIAMVLLITGCEARTITNIQKIDTNILFDIGVNKGVFFGSIDEQEEEGFKPFRLYDINDAYKILSDAYKKDQIGRIDIDGKLIIGKIPNTRYLLLKEYFENKKYNIQFSAAYQGYSKIMNIYLVDKEDDSFREYSYAFLEGKDQERRFDVNLEGEFVN